MIDVYVDLKEIANSLFENKDELLKVIAAVYAEDYYGQSIEQESDENLSEFEDCVENDNEDFLVNIQNTLANVDNMFDEDHEDGCQDQYEEDDYEDDCQDQYEEDDYEEEPDSFVDVDTLRLMEENRRKNEAALGL